MAIAMFVLWCLVYFSSAVSVLLFWFIFLFHFDSTGKLKLRDWWRPSFRKKCRMLPAGKQVSIFRLPSLLMNMDIRDFWVYIGYWVNNVGDIALAGSFVMPILHIMSVEDIEILFNCKQSIAKGRQYHFLKSWLGEGLLLSTDAKWHFRRKLLTPTFHFKILKDFVHVFNRNAKRLMIRLTADGAEHSSPLNIESLMSKCTLGIICETTMGISLDIQSEECSVYVAAIRRASEIVLKRSLTFWMYPDLAFNCSSLGREYKKVIGQIHGFTRKVIEKRKKHYKPVEMTSIDSSDDYRGVYKQRLSFLDCLIEFQKENPTSLTDEDIREEVDTFMFEGHDTVSASIIWTLFAIATHPEVQVGVLLLRYYRTWDVNQMQYLDMVLKEALRMYPPVPILGRGLTNDVQLGVTVLVMPYMLHRDPRWYPEPEKFDPLRFLPELVKERHAYAYIPFSASFRNCIGQKFAVLEAKIVLATILRTLRVSTTLKKEDVIGIPGLILRPSPKITLSFSPLGF